MDQTAQLRMLNRIGQIVVASQDTGELFGEILTRLREMVGAQGVLIFVERNGQLLVEAQDYGIPVELHNQGVPVGEGIAGEVWSSQKGAILSGAACTARLYPPLIRRYGEAPQSFLAAPITWQDRRFGVIAAVHPDADRFSAADLELVESAAAWTAIALMNAEQHRMLARRLAESEITANLLEEILNAEPSLRVVLQHIVEAGLNLVEAVDWAAIHLIDESGRRLYLNAVAGINISAEDYTLDAGQGIAGRVFESGALINVPDVNRDERVESYPRRSHAHALLVAPVKDRDNRVIGTLTLQSSSAGRFTEQDERLLILLAHQAGIAIEHARLYEAVERRRELAQIQQVRLRHLTHRMVTAQEDERERLARELHDEAGQSLTALKISLDVLAGSLPPDLGEQRAALQDAAGQAGALLENLRSIAHNLRPPALDRLGLNLALAGLCQQFESMTHIRTEYSSFELPRMPGTYEITLYRFVQEALTNIARHAGASRVRVWMETKTGQLEIHVQDDGQGLQVDPFDPGRADSAGMGLAGMEERMRIIGGRLDVDSAPGGGTHLRAAVTLRRREGTL